MLQLRILESLTDARNYNRWLADLALPFLGHHPVEVGSGLGEFASLWLESGVPRITVSERDPAGVSALRDRLGHDGRVDVVQIDMTQPSLDGRLYSSAVALNVLEHIRDDTGALAAMSGRVEPGGAIIVLVPAHPFAMSAFDRAIGHWRRYTTRTLTATFRQSGLDLEEIHHVNAPGLLAWFVGMRLLRRTPSDTRAVQAYDRLVVPVARRIESAVKPPFGQSLLAIGRRPA